MIKKEVIPVEVKICSKCNKDHSKKGTGALSVCELREYFSQGAPGIDQKGKTYYAFGTGNRFQFVGAR